MPVVIRTEPDAITPSDNPLVWTFSSSSYTQSNFVFVVDLYINNNKFSTHYVFSERSSGSSGYAHFDASDIVKGEVDEISENVPTSPSLAIGLNLDEVYLVVTERYGATPTLQDSATTSTIRTFKSRLDDLDWIDFDYTQYFYTNVPSNMNYYIGYDDVIMIPFRNNLVLDTITYELFNSSGVSITSNTYTLPASFSTKYLSYLLAHPSQLVGAGLFLEADFDNCAYVEITSDASAEKFTYYLDRESCIYPIRRFYFLSKLGHWESFAFKLVSKESTQSTAKGYNKEFGKWVNTTFNFSKNYGRKQDYVVDSVDTLVCNSDWIDETTQNWLQQMYESPSLYLYDVDGDFYRAVTFKNRTFEKKQKEVDTLFNEVIEVEYSNIRKSMLL